MTQQPVQRDRAGMRPATRRLAAAAAVAMMATLAVPALSAAGAAAAGRTGSGPGMSAAGQLASARGGNNIRAWGDNGEGQLGNGSTTPSLTPVLVNVALKLGTTITSVRTGCDNSLALTSTGQVLAWGSNGFGQLGDGTTTSSDTPVMVSLPPGTTVTAIRAGCQFSLALTSTGQVLGWGLNGHGQLGNGTTTNSDTPVPVRLPGHARVRAISTGGVHSLALVSKRKVLAWGNDTFGELGDGRTGGDRLTPVRVRLPKGVRVTAVAGGGQSSLARTTKGKVLAWGFNGDGELGNGRTATSDVPVRTRLPHGTRVRGVVAGCGHALALTTKGKILAWGRNDHGQLGNGSSARRSRIPVRVKLRRKVTAISAGCTHGLARTASGRVLAWGDNFFGELGNGTTTSRRIPVRVQLPAAAVAIGSGPVAFVNLAITSEAAE